MITRRVPVSRDNVTFYDCLTTDGNAYIDIGLNVGKLTTGDTWSIDTKSYNVSGTGSYVLHGTNYTWQMQQLMGNTYYYHYDYAVTSTNATINVKYSATSPSNMSTYSAGARNWTISSIPNLSTLLAKNLLLFACNYATYIDKCASGSKIYYFRLFHNGVMIRNMVPCSYNGVYGMWDLIEDKFYGNVGSGSFTTSGTCTYKEDKSVKHIYYGIKPDCKLVITGDTINGEAYTPLQYKHESSWMGIGITLPTKLNYGSSFKTREAHYSNYWGFAKYGEYGKYVWLYTNQSFYIAWTPGSPPFSDWETTDSSGNKIANIDAIKAKLNLKPLKVYYNNCYYKYIYKMSDLLPVIQNEIPAVEKGYKGTQNLIYQRDYVGVSENTLGIHQSMDIDGASITCHNVGVDDNIVAESPNTVWAEIETTQDTALQIDGAIVPIYAGKVNVIKDFQRFCAYDASTIHSNSNITRCDLFYNGRPKILQVRNYNLNTINNLDKTQSALSGITSLDVSQWDTSDITDGLYLGFFGCNNIEKLDVSNWNTSKVTNLCYTFRDMKKITELDVSGWDTSKVTTMYGTFINNYLLPTLDVSNWNTGNTTTLYYTFKGCSSVQTLDVSNWDTSKVTNMQYTFYGCQKVKELDVSNWKTDNVTDIKCVFAGCVSLKALPNGVENWNTSNVTNMQQVFYNIARLSCVRMSIDLTGWDTSKVTNMYSMFSQSTWIEKLDLSTWDTSSITECRSMFYACNRCYEILFGPGWGKQTSTAESALTISFYGTSKYYNVGQEAATPYALSDKTWESMLTMYDRASAGLPNMTIKLHSKHNIPDGWKEKMTARGYTIVIAS